jgi:acetyltransferase-like isoleucine patch superfamily enzyme
VPNPSAFARFGNGSWIVPPAVVERPEQIEVGNRVVILEGAMLRVGPAGRLVIGDRVRLTRFVAVDCSTSITLEDDVGSSDGVSIIDSWGPGHPPEPVVIEAGAYLGMGSTVGPGVTVGRGAFVGEGAVVIDDVAPHNVVYGNPAQVVRRLEGSTWVGPLLP